MLNSKASLFTEVKVILLVFKIDLKLPKNPFVDRLTEVEVTFVAFDLINSSIVKQLKAVKAEVLHLAHTHPSLQSASSWDARA